MNAEPTARNMNQGAEKNLFSQGRPVAVLTSEHILVGRVPTKNVRLLDVLNDSRSDFLHIHDVRIFRRRENICLSELAECVVPKSKVRMVLIMDNQHEAQVKRRNNFVDKEQTAVFLTADGYEVRGSLHLSRAADPVRTLTQTLGHFFAVTEARVSPVISKSEMTQVAVAIVNRECVDTFALGDAVAGETPESEPQSQTAGAAP